MKKLSFVITDDRPVNLKIRPRTGQHLKTVILFVATGRDRQSINLVALHDRPRSGHDITVRGVVFDEASVTFKGLIEIAPGAKGTNAHLKADALLMGDKAQADLVPSLSVKENEVQAGHGATVGRVNDEQIFYLMSRGLRREQAVELLVRGFVKPVLDDLPHRQRDEVERAITQVYEHRQRFSHLRPSSRIGLS